MRDLEALTNEDLLDEFADAEREAGRWNDAVGYLPREERDQLNALRAEVMRRLDASI